MVLQSYVIPLADFEGVDVGRLAEVRFVFDRAVAGTVVIDDIGLATPDPAFLRAPVSTVEP